MKNAYHNLSLQGITGILVGLLSLIFIFSTAFLLNQFSSGTGGISMLPISFFQILLISITLIFIIIGYFSITLINKYRRKKNQLKNWEPRAKQIRKIFFAGLVLGGIILYFLMNEGLLNYIISVSLLIYGISCIIAHKYTKGNTGIFGITFLMFGISAALFPSYMFYFFGLAFGINHILYGLHFYKGKNIEG